VETGFAAVVHGASTACASALSALAASSSSGWEAASAGSQTMSEQRTRGVASSTPSAWRCTRVSSAPESVVGTAIARASGPRAAATALATSTTRPPPSAT
jgi:hypothetical protein